jgi:predicted  nucleic acid-binding Zn-ribbon protein
VALDAKTDISTSSQRRELLERELEDLKERFRATEQLIQDEKNLIASSKQEAENLTTQLKTELAELSTLSRHIVLGEDKDDEAAIVEANCVRLEAIVAIDEFLQ